LVSNQSLSIGHPSVDRQNKDQLSYYVNRHSPEPLYLSLDGVWPMDGYGNGNLHWLIDSFGSTRVLSLLLSVNHQSYFILKDQKHVLYNNVVEIQFI